MYQGRIYGRSTLGPLMIISQRKPTNRIFTVVNLDQR